MRITPAPGLRTVLLLLPLATALSAAITPTTAEAGDEEAQDGAEIKIEIKQPDAKIVKHKVVLEALDMDFDFDFEGEGHKHKITLSVSKTEDKKKVSVTMAYERDGEAIFAPFTMEWKIKKREVIWTDDSQYAVALTIKPKKIKPKTRKRDDDAIKGDEDDEGNPLDGLD